MKQYCRYCQNAHLIDDDCIWCEAKDEIRTNRKITRLNKCRDFEFNEMDVLDYTKTYKPRKKVESDYEQIKMDI